MRGLIRTAALAVATGVALTGCAATPAAPGTELEVMVPRYSDKTEPYWTDLARAFEAKNPGVHITLVVRGWDEIQQAADTRILAGNPPDVLELDAAGPAYGKRGLLYTVDDVVSSRTLDDIVPSFLKGGEIDRQDYGLPTVASTRALFYNQDLFARAGVTAPPTTWDELLAAARRITALGDGVAGYGMPLGGEEAQAEASIWAFGAGASWEANGKIVVDSPEAVAGLSFAKKLIDQGLTQPNPAGTNRTPLLDQFIQGRIGMITGLPPVVDEVRTRNPALHWGIAPSPSRDGTPFTLGVADYFVAFRKDGGKRDAIRKFLDFFYQTDNYVRFNDNEGFIPATVSGAGAAATRPELKTFLDALPGAKFYPSELPAWAATKNGFQSLLGQIQTRPVADVLHDIQARAGS